MQRIAILKDHWKFTPTAEDFKEQDAYILITRMAMMYALKQNGEVNMVHESHFNDIAVRLGVDTKIKELLCGFIENLPENCWNKAVAELSFKQTV